MKESEGRRPQVGELANALKQREQDVEVSENWRLQRGQHAHAHWHRLKAGQCLKTIACSKENWPMLTGSTAMWHPTAVQLGKDC